MHLEIAAKTLTPRRIGFENHLCVSPREKIASQRRNPESFFRRFFEPGLKLIRDEGTYPVQLSQRTARTMQIIGTLGPAEGAPCRTPEGANENAGTGLCYSGQQFSQIGVRNRSAPSALARPVQGLVSEG